MSVTVGELQVILSGDLSRLDRDMDRIDKRVVETEKKHTAAWQRTGITAGQAIRAGMLSAERDADKIGNRTGGKLSQGINAGLIRNSPLIAAAIGGALIAGAPLVTAGAVAMFAGAGAVAASQSLEIRESWTQLGHEIRGGMVADAAVLVPAYSKMADQIGQSFQRMRPQIREAFTDSVPLVDSFTDGVIALGENAMPGFVRAVERAHPVMDGFEDFLASTGTGVTGFLDGISSHGPAAGAVFTSLGAVVGDLLPILGELLGQGAELAADVLPAVAVATGTTLDVLQMLGPMLPGIVTGFVAFKAAQTAAGYLQTFAVQAQYATTAMTGSVTAGNRVGTALSGLGKSLPAVGIAVGVVTSAIAQGEAQFDSWARGLLEGGAAARQVRSEMQATSEHFSGWQGVVANFTVGGAAMTNALGDTSAMMEEAQARADALYDAMSPLQQAEQDVEKATALLSEKLKVYGAGSNEAEGAARALESQQRLLEERQGALELAIEGVTSAMIAQAEQALAAASSDYAYRQSLEGIDDAIAGIAEAQRQEAEAAAAAAEARRIHGAGSDEAAEAERRYAAATEATSDAQFRLEGTLLGAAEAAGRLAADALPATASELQKQQAASAGSLAELERLKTEMGANFPPALQLAIDRLKQSGVALTNTQGAASVTAGAMRDLGLSVTEIPGQKFVRVDAPTAEQKQRLLDLGYHVTNLPNGDIYVSTDTATANAAIDYAARTRTATIRVIPVEMNQVAGRRYAGVLEFAGGGYTGNMGVRDVAGVVHGREFVTDAEKTARWRPVLEAIHAGNDQAAAMLAVSTSGVGGRAAGSGASPFGGGSGSAGAVHHHKHYDVKATVNKTLTLRELMALLREADALYG